MGKLKTFLIGEGERYRYGPMCTPNLPWRSHKAKLNFYEKDEELPLLMSIFMGLQHTMAMIGALITPPLVVFRFSVCGEDACPELVNYAISAALISAGICTILNILQLEVPFSEKFLGRKLHVGSGVLSIMGTSFTFLPIYEIAIGQMKRDGIDGRTAYGKMLGTSMVCCLLELGISVLPVKRLKALFPPMVSSITVILIGVALTGTGMKYWGGGVVCAEMGWKIHSQLAEQDITTDGPGPYCINGNTSELYGSPQYIGLGFAVLVCLVLIELFGSVFMKNCNVVLALLVGYLVAGLTDLDGASYVDASSISSAPPITFLWVETFPIGFYGPAVLPMLIAYLVVTLETVGDIAATYESSLLDTKTREYEASVQGALTADALNSILSNLFTSMPNTTYSENNGVIALTKCASKRAGYACGGWLIFLGVFGKAAGILTSIPDCVLGGMLVFLFANVLASGIHLTQQVDLDQRRNRFIMAFALALGVGVSIWPYAFLDRRGSPYTAPFWSCQDCGPTLQGFRNGVALFLSTGYCVGSVAAMILNGILPSEPSCEEENDDQPKAASPKKSASPEDEIPLGISQENEA